jgi:hypothetical protein
MEITNIDREMASLPPDAQKQVMDFVAFLKARYSSTPAARKAKRTRLADEPFIGMWQTRKDIPDGAEWVRNLRQSEWARSA